MTLRLVSRILLHLLQHFFFAHALLAARTARRMTFVIIVLIVSVVAKLRRTFGFRVHHSILITHPAMHQAHFAHNT